MTNWKSIIMCVLFCEINYYLSFLVLNLLTHSLTYCGIVSMMQKHCRSAPSNSFKCFFWIKMIYVTSNLSQNVPGCSVCICPQTCHHSVFVYMHLSTDMPPFGFCLHALVAGSYIIFIYNKKYRRRVWLTGYAPAGL